MAHFSYALTSSIIDPSFKLISQNQKKIGINTITKDPTHLKCVATLVKCQCLQSNNWKQD